MWTNGLTNSESGYFSSPVQHRHVVFTLPEQLREIIRRDRRILALLFPLTFTTALSVFSYKCKTTILPGVVGVLHTFGNDLKQHPHFDCIVTDGGVNDAGDWISVEASYKSWRKVWQYQVLTALRKYLPPTKENEQLIDSLFKKYPDGFVVYAKDRISRDNKKFLGYIARYIRHPPIANSRIIYFDDKKVTFSCEQEKGKKIEVTMDTFSFISAILLHLPEEGEHLIKYYGIYSHRKKSYYFNLLGFITKLKRLSQQRLFKKAPKCPRCGSIMDLVYASLPKHQSVPPPIGSLIPHWF